MLGQILKGRMKAVVVAKFGGPEVLKVVSDLPIPEVQQNEVLIKVKAAGVNPIDTYIRNGQMPVLPELPYVPGKDVAGVIAKVGCNVVNYKPGDRVFSSFSSRTGGYAEYTAVDSNYVFPLDEKISFVQGASIGIPYFTAYRALFLKSTLKTTDQIFIHGASGGVGIAAVQLAKAAGCKNVIGSAGSEEGMRIVKDAGADHVIPHLKSTNDQEIMKITDNKGLDLVLEMLADANLEYDMSVMNDFGKIFVIGSRGSIEINPRMLMDKESSICGLALKYITADECKGTGVEICKGLQDGSLIPLVDMKLKSEDVQLAHKTIIDKKSSKGNIVLTF